MLNTNNMIIKNNYIDFSWKEIAKGHTAFCILGGPSTKQVKNLQDIIDNNFTVTVNHNIKTYPNCDMYVTADNSIAREYFEDKEFCLFKFTGGKLLKNQAGFNYNEEPIWIQGKKEIIQQNPNLIKIIACNEFPIYNYSFTTGQLSKHHGEEYCKNTPNTHICIEQRNEQGESWPLLSPEIPESIAQYGKDPQQLISGGNISGILFQLLWFMGFDKVIVVGYGDNGTSNGYDDKIFEWSNEEIHAMVTHNTVWKDKLTSLHGSEICREYCDFKQSSYNELENTPTKKQKLINKLLAL
jgi:hypothetical protein